MRQELSEHEMDALIAVMSDTFMRLIGGRPCVAAAASMGVALRETISDPEALASALSVLVMNATASDQLVETGVQHFEN